MAKKGGLGRGLKALIPDPVEDQESAGDKEEKFKQEKPDEEEKKSANKSPSKKIQENEQEKGNKSQLKTGKEVQDEDSQLGEPSSNKKEDQEGRKVENEHSDRLFDLSLEDLEADPDQPRKDFDQEGLEELAQSIQEYGLIQPIVVVKQTRKGHPPYRIVAGERRFRAASLLGLDKVPVLEKARREDEMPYLSVVENIQREDLSPIEEATAYQTIMRTEFLTQADLAKKLGKSRSYVANTVRLLQLDDASLKALKDGLLTSSQARSLLAEPDLDKRAHYRQLLIEGKTNVNQLEKKTGRRKRSKGRKNIYLTDMENRLSQSLGTKVEIRKRRKGYSLQIDCYSDEDLNQFADRILKGGD